VRILLDENLPEGLIEPLRGLDHTVDSVGSLRLKGLDNGCERPASRACCSMICGATEPHRESDAPAGDD
jgi:hypothetical protein